jgi:hypothetical protein
VLTPPSPKLHCHEVTAAPLLASVNCTVNGAVPLEGLVLKLAMKGADGTFPVRLSVKLAVRDVPTPPHVSTTVYVPGEA